MNTKKTAAVRQVCELNCSAGAGDFRTAARLLMEFEFSREQLIRALGNAAEQGHSHYCNLLLLTRDFSREELVGGEYPVYCKAIGGAGEVNRVFSQRLQYAREEIARPDNLPLVCAIESHDLKTVQWLVETYELTADDIRSNNGIALAVAVGEENLSALKWLHVRFALTAGDFKNIQARGETKKWIEETFPKDTRAGALAALASLKRDIGALTERIETLAECIEQM